MCEEIWLEKKVYLDHKKDQPFSFYVSLTWGLDTEASISSVSQGLAANNNHEY